MKKIISIVLIASFFTFSVFPTDRYEKIAEKACKTVTGEGMGLSTVEKVAGVAGVAGVVGGLLVAGKMLYDAANKDKYENIADKAFEAIENMN